MELQAKAAKRQQSGNQRNSGLVSDFGASFGGKSVEKVSGIQEESKRVRNDAQERRKRRREFLKRPFRQ